MKRDRHLDFFRGFYPQPAWKAFSIGAACWLSACSSTPKAPPTADPLPPAPSASAEVSAQEQIRMLKDKVIDLETRISALNEKISLEQGGAPASQTASHPSTHQAHPATAPSIAVSVPHTTPVQPSAAAARTIPSEKVPPDEGVDRYREAKILFDTGKHADAGVELVAFIKHSPDHPYAPAAQFLLGQSYFLQKEYGRAEEEWNRGLVNYPHSNFVPDTLLALMELAQAQQKDARANYFKQKILGTFPNSPHAVKAALKTDSKAEKSKMESDQEPTLIPGPDAPAAPDAPKVESGKSPS